MGAMNTQPDRVGPSEEVQEGEGYELLPAAFVVEADTFR